MEIGQSTVAGVAGLGEQTEVGQAESADKGRLRSLCSGVASTQSRGIEQCSDGAKGQQHEHDGSHGGWAQT